MISLIAIGSKSGRLLPKTSMRFTVKCGKNKIGTSTLMTLPLNTCLMIDPPCLLHHKCCENAIKMMHFCFNQLRDHKVHNNENKVMEMKALI